MIYTMKLRARFHECGIHGIVHHSNYGCWMDMAQSALLEDNGLRFADFMDDGYYFPILEQHIKFLSPAYYDEEILIRTWLTELGYVKVTFAYELIHARDGKLIAKAESTHAFLGEDLRPLNVQRRYPVLYQALQPYLEK